MAIAKTLPDGALPSRNFFGAALYKRVINAGGGGTAV